jgi:hypothetical protein
VPGRSIGTVHGVTGEYSSLPSWFRFPAGIMFSVLFLLPEKKPVFTGMRLLFL